MTEQKETTKPANRRGHNAMVTGLAIVVFAAIVALAQWDTNPGMSGFAILVAVGGFVTGMVGVGMRRER